MEWYTHCLLFLVFPPALLRCQLLLSIIHQFCTLGEMVVWLLSFGMKYCGVSCLGELADAAKVLLEPWYYYCIFCFVG
jgi:hypothetical protein